MPGRSHVAIEADRCRPHASPSGQMRLKFARTVCGELNSRMNGHANLAARRREIVKSLNEIGGSW